MQQYKILKRLFIVLLLAALLIAHFYIPRFITEIRNPLIVMIKGNQKISSLGFENNSLKGKYINFKSFDNLQLSSYLTFSSLDTTKGTIILLHGIRSNKESFLELSSKLSKVGYNTVALDSRAHGNSEGTHCTFGVKERKDISQLITVLAKKEQLTDNIGVWGQSLGGAIGLQAIGSDNRIHFAIIESTFSDFTTITNAYFKYHLGFNIRPLTNYLVYRAGKIAGFDPKEANPNKYCKKIKQPILMVHGKEDKRIDIQYAHDNFEQIPNKQKQFIEIKDANHLTVWKVGGDAYFKKVITFIAKNTHP